MVDVAKSIHIIIKVIFCLITLMILTMVDINYHQIFPVKVKVKLNLSNLLAKTQPLSPSTLKFSFLLFLKDTSLKFVALKIETMSLKQKIDSDIKTAMLAKNKEELDALRSIKSMILLAETEKGVT